MGGLVSDSAGGRGADRASASEGRVDGEHRDDRAAGQPAAGGRGAGWTAAKGMRAGRGWRGVWLTEAAVDVEDGACGVGGFFGEEPDGVCDVLGVASAGEGDAFEESGLFGVGGVLRPQDGAGCDGVGAGVGCECEGPGAGEAEEGGFAGGVGGVSEVSLAFDAVGHGDDAAGGGAEGGGEAGGEELGGDDVHLHERGHELGCGVLEFGGGEEAGVVEEEVELAGEDVVVFTRDGFGSVGIAQVASQEFAFGVERGALGGE